MKVSIDIDDVLFPFMDLFLSFINDLEGTNYKIDTARHWDLEKAFNWDAGKFLYYYQCFAHADGFMIPETVEPSTVDVLNSIKMAGHSIILNTARGANFSHLYPGILHDTYYWLNEKNIPHDAIVFTHQKQLIDADIYVDDGVHNFTSLDNKVKVCYDRPWNQHWNGIRINTLNQLLLIVNNTHMKGKKDEI